MLPGIARCSFLSPNPLQKKQQEEGLRLFPHLFHSLWRSRKKEWALQHYGGRKKSIFMYERCCLQCCFSCYRASVLRNGIKDLSLHSKRVKEKHGKTTVTNAVAGWDCYSAIGYPGVFYPRQILPEFARICSTKASRKRA